MTHRQLTLEEYADLVRRAREINESQARIAEMRCEAGVKPGEPLFGLRLEEHVN